MQFTWRSSSVGNGDTVRDWILKRYTYRSCIYCKIGRITWDVRNRATKLQGFGPDEKGARLFIWVVLSIFILKGKRNF